MSSTSSLPQKLMDQSVVRSPSTSISPSPLPSLNISSSTSSPSTITVNTSSSSSTTIPIITTSSSPSTFRIHSSNPSINPSTPNSLPLPIPTEPVTLQDTESSFSDNDTFSLADDLEDKIVADYAFCLVGKVIVDKPYRKQSVSEGLLRAWNAVKDVQVHPLEADHFVFKFEHELDMQNVLLDGPWSVNGNLIVLEKWQGYLNNSFTHCDFWVQFHDVPVDLRSTEVLLGIAQKFGTPHY
ncbi:PR domain zinc finger protein 2-like [Telopea speciosissima]|uniref:PR domain zinc finger protein 2-like n=1 Tax=Telopea speciosissima TaxID=54955 RepID=UPI001CC4793A|nr:PR domain zinc finger protein 2-like [Telopea speciosissima]